MIEKSIQSLIDQHMAGDDCAVLALTQQMDVREQWHPYQGIMMAEAAARLCDRSTYRHVLRAKLALPSSFLGDHRHASQSLVWV